MRQRLACIGLLLTLALPVRADRIVDLRDLETPRVAQITFVHLGEKPIGNRELRAAMVTTEDGRFARRYFRGDLATIENLYRSRGYMDVDIVRRIFALNDDGDLHITLKIDSGDLWKVSKVDLQFTGTDSLLAAILKSRLHVAPADVFRYGEVVQDERDLLVWLNSEGFAHAVVRNGVTLDSRHSQAAVRYFVTTGRRMYFGAVTIEETDLQTRRSMLERQITFREGRLYDPEQLRRTRNNLSSTGLFRSVTLATPSVAAGDSVQPVVLRLQERKFVRLRSRLFVNNSEPGISGRVQHTNFLGRGNQIGTDASLGQPLQGLTLFLTERNLLGSAADLTLSAGVTDEWEDKRVFANPYDATQFDLLTSNYSLANELMLLLGPDQAAEFLTVALFDYPSVQRLWKLNAVINRRWELADDVVYTSNMTMNWTQSRNRPIRGREINFLPEEDPAAIGVAPVDPGDGSDTGFGDDPFGDDPFGDDPFGDDPFGDATPGANGGPAPSGRLAQSGAFPYDPGPNGVGRIPLDDTWITLLTNEARTLNFQLDFQRDTRDNQITPTRGMFMRSAALYAIELGGSRSRVFDGDVEARNYQPIGGGLVWAQAARAVMTGSLRRESALPQLYWKTFGGEGSVRGVARNSIDAAGGGRGGLVLRNELRLAAGRAGFVLFWDRAGVWRRVSQAAWGDMINGYGAGVRWDLGIPLRLDLGWSGRRRVPSIYVSIGQAF
ncbi:MAG: BamA/TamA family outer membrane protein [bacterium]|nr:BamA/TamA family outer membrane protein [bacterium]